MSFKIKLFKFSLLVLSLFTLNANAAIDLECSSCKKQIEGYRLNKEILEKKLDSERSKEVINQDVISAIELRVKEYDEKISELEDVLDICQGKSPKPDSTKCLRFKNQIEALELNVKILEEKISTENAKENPSAFVVNAAQVRIQELKVQIKNFQEILDSCEEAQK